MDLYTCKLVDIITSEERTVMYEPLGLSGIKTTWQFSTDFPIGCNAEISTDNIKFIKEDAEWLRNEYESFGEGAAIRLDVRTYGGSEFSFKLDFSTYNFDGAFVEVGLKGTPLKDKISVINGTKIKFENENAIRLSPLNVSAKIRTKNTAQSPQKQVAVSYKYHKITNTLNVDFGNVTWDNAENTYGYQLGLEIKPTKLSYSLNGTGMKIYFPKTNHSLISFPIQNDTTGSENAHLHFKIEAIAKNKISATNNYIRLQVNKAFEYFFEDGSSTFSFYSSEQVAVPVGTMNTSKKMLLEFDSVTDLHGDYATHDQVGNACTFIMCHYYLCGWYYGEYALVDEVMFSTALTFEFQNIEITHDLCRLESNNFLSVGILPLLQLINDTFGVTFVAETNSLNNARIATYSILSGKSTEMELNITDIMQTLSLCYGLAFVEESGIYHIYDIEDYFAQCKINAIEIVDFYNLRTYNEQTFDTISIGEDEENLSNKAEFEIFKADKFKIRDLHNARKTDNEMQLSGGIDYAGSIIFDKIISANGGDDLLLIDRFDGRNWLNPYLNQPYLQINEYLSNWRIINRNKNWLYSFMAYRNPLVSENYLNYYSEVPCDDYVADCQSAIGTDSKIFKHWNVDVTVKFDWNLISQLKDSPKALYFNGKYYFPIKYECNIEPNTILITCKEYL